MRILFLTQWFQPEPFFKGLPFARELVKRGHSVQVLTGFPNYPGGKLYPGYRVRLFSKENVEGVSVIRVALYPSHDQSALRRILNYASFAISAAFLGPFLIEKADVMYVYHQPPSVGFAATTIRLFRGIPFVFDIQDLWPDSLSATGMIQNRFALSVINAWCLLVYRFASKLVVLSPGFKERLVSRGVAANKIQVLYNWSPDEGAAAETQTILAEDPLWQNRFNVLFAGNMGPAQGLETVLSAAEAFKRLAPEVQFVMVGSGIAVDALKAIATERHLFNVVFLPRVSNAEIGVLLKKADALLVHLKNDPLFAITIPSKTQAYLAAGRPILMGVEGDAARLVERAGAGLTFKPGDVDGLITAVEQLRRLSREERIAMGERARRFYEDNLSRSATVAKFEELFSSVA